MSEGETMEVAESAPAVTERLQALRPEEAYEVRHWWRRLTLPAEELKAFTQAPPWPKGVRARLRRCESLEAAMLAEAFRTLWHRVEQVGKHSIEPRDSRLQAWACIALILSELRKDISDVPLGRQLGQQKSETGKPCMSELRFQQLMSCQSSEELIKRLRRALRLVDSQDKPDKRGVSVVHLADNIALWWRESRGELAPQPSSRLGFLWANDYFEALSRYQRASD
ncbi:type I-E CRISPR-associated protein Cse2/CasB [Halomonas sp. LBP4]|uniref:type I-E CRISPR-associated protein Cse2/CasB n=1 Tax=Halomonas sp. LBP4 TaxID=2044917 RepID=UPI000D75F1F7|nr:type I-E CRISPR-associated protein Cse2/CasB [Halomonas sp. LBP4]PXX96300.1 type I-E CRISPR-associated protein Cse2/CasB [Halomonas sp. LBP4]